MVDSSPIKNAGNFFPSPKVKDLEDPGARRQGSWQQRRKQSAFPPIYRQHRKIMKATVGGTPSRMVVSPTKRASTVNRHSKAEAKRGVHLGLKLTNVTCEEDQHGKTSSKENVDDPIRKASESGSFNWTSGHVHAENDDGNLELTSQKVTVEVISAVLVKFLVHGGKIAFLHLLLLSALS
jgi:hypothetical protein